jgi:hypothetical protein
VVLAHIVSLLIAKNDTLQKANEALSKYKRAEKIHVSGSELASYRDAKALTKHRAKNHLHTSQHGLSSASTP